jgi:hypothetical protein
MSKNGHKAHVRSLQPTPQPESMNELLIDANVCVNYDDPTTLTALELLRDAGFSVRSTAVSGLASPRVTVKSGTYYGLKQIRELVKSIR